MRSMPRGCRRILFALDAATTPEALVMVGPGVHLLRGDRRGQWSVWVSANWRLVFEFDGKDATDVDLVDYH